ncbi:MAG: hypothetical protein ACRDT2_03475 [Natronosporangium sp.]
MARRAGSDGWRPDRAGAALAWLAHPVTALAVVVLVLNDHLFKFVYPGLVTGKLSDLAGLVVAPAFLALAATLVVPRLPGQVAAVGALAVTGVGFAVVKSTDAGATAASAAWGVLNGPSVIRVDLTDLATLPALGLAWWAWTRARQRPAPQWLVRLAQVLVVLPAAAMAVSATSPAAYLYAAAVTEWDGAVVVGEDTRYQGDAPPGWDWRRLSEDGGLTWRHLEPAEERAVDAQEAQLGRERETGCVPGAQTHCYRVVPGQLRVEETRDGGTTWATSWEVTDADRDTLRRHYPRLGDPSVHLSSRELAVVELEGRNQHAVVVANGRDGYAVYDGRVDRWQRVGFGDGEPPPPLGADDQPLQFGYLWGLVGAVAALMVTAEVLRRRRAGFMRWPDKLGLLLLGSGLATLFAAAAIHDAWQRDPDPLLPLFVVFAGWAFAVLLTLVGLGLWVALLVLVRALTGRQWLVAAPAAVLTGALATLPLMGSSALPVGAPVAGIAAVLLWGAGTAAGTAMAWAVDRGVDHGVTVHDQRSGSVSL